MGHRDTFGSGSKEGRARWRGGLQGLKPRALIPASPPLGLTWGRGHRQPRGKAGPPGPEAAPPPDEHVLLQSDHTLGLRPRPPQPPQLLPGVGQHLLTPRSPPTPLLSRAVCPSMPPRPRVTSGPTWMPLGLGSGPPTLQRCMRAAQACTARTGSHRPAPRVGGARGQPARQEWVLPTGGGRQRGDVSPRGRTVCP